MRCTSMARYGALLRAAADLQRLPETSKRHADGYCFDIARMAAGFWHNRVRQKNLRVPSRGAQRVH
jgi:hypothetical protein